MDQPTRQPASPPAALPGSSPPMDLTGKTLGEYVIHRRLGQGGMGQVYLAEQTSLKRKVALKVLKPEMSANETSLKRFRQEAEAVARATHANIVQVYAIGEGEGVHFMALEFVDGFTLKDYLLKKGPPELALALSIMRQVASALARAAELGIIHRDVKPENILMTRKGEVKVADFGLSRCFGDDQQPLNLTQTGTTMGTPLYMSPEQVQGKPTDPRTDVYSFGVTCYHMLGGQPPFRGESAFAVAIQHVQNQPSPLCALRPDLPADLCAVVDKMMAKKPEDRYQTAREIIREINRIRESLSLTASVPAVTTGLVPPAPPPERPVSVKPARARLKRAVLVVLSLILATLGGAALAWKLGPGTSMFSTAASPLVSEEERLLEHETRALAAADPRKPEARLRAQLNLGLFYLERGRPADADVFFTQLGTDPQSRDVSLLGRGLVLSAQDRAKESNQAFLELEKRLNDPAQPAALLVRNPRVRMAIARALERNYLANEAAKESFPAELDRLRRPGPLTPRKG